MGEALVGQYKLRSVENVNNFFAALDMCLLGDTSESNQELVIYQSHGIWSITIYGELTYHVDFKLGRPYLEYNETFETSGFQCITTLRGNTLTTVGIGLYKDKDLSITRFLKPTEAGCILILTHLETGNQARWFFVRE